MPDQGEVDSKDSAKTLLFTVLKSQYQPLARWKGHCRSLWPLSVKETTPLWVWDGAHSVTGAWV